MDTAASQKRDAYMAALARFAAEMTNLRVFFAMVVVLDSEKLIDEHTILDLAGNVTIDSAKKLFKQELEFLGNAEIKLTNYQHVQ